MKKGSLYFDIDDTKVNTTIEKQALVLGFWISYLNLLEAEINSIIYSSTFIKNKIKNLNDINSLLKNLIIKVRDVKSYSNDHTIIIVNLENRCSKLMERIKL